MNRNNSDALSFRDSIVEENKMGEMRSSIADMRSSCKTVLSPPEDSSDISGINQKIPDVIHKQSIPPIKLE